MENSKPAFKELQSTLLIIDGIVRTRKDALTAILEEQDFIIQKLALLRSECVHEWDYYINHCEPHEDGVFYNDCIIVVRTCCTCGEKEQAGLLDLSFNHVQDTFDLD